MDKKQYAFQDAKEEMFAYEDKMIKIKPFLSFGEQLLLIKSYIQMYSDVSNLTRIDSLTSDRFGAEWILMVSVIDMCTDIDTDELRDYDYHLYRIWDIVRGKIINYNIFIDLLEKSVQEYVIQKNSVSSVLQTFIENLNDGLDAEKIKSLTDEVGKVMETLNNSPIKSLQM